MDPGSKFYKNYSDDEATTYDILDSAVSCFKVYNLNIKKFNLMLY